MLVVEKQVLDFLKSTNLPLNKSQERNVVPNSNPDEPVDVPGFKAPCDRYKLIGIYEGAQYATGMAYRPTGLCKMRRQSEDGPGDGEFCHVCKYLIVSRIEPALHGLLDLRYYPTPKKRNG
jgi:hypothetical protein